MYVSFIFFVLICWINFTMICANRGILWAPLCFRSRPEHIMQTSTRITTSSSRNLCTAPTQRKLQREEGVAASRTYVLQYIRSSSSSSSTSQHYSVRTGWWWCEIAAKCGYRGACARAASAAVSVISAGGRGMQKLNSDARIPFAHGEHAAGVATCKSN